MITRAKIKQPENDRTAIATAIDAYQQRYGALPGDDPAASTRFAGEWRGSDNGKGDGLMTGGWSSISNGLEARKFWKHLRGADEVRRARSLRDRFPSLSSG